MLPTLEIRLVQARPRYLLVSNFRSNAQADFATASMASLRLPQNATFKNALQHIGDEVQIIRVATQIDAIDPAARAEV